MRVNIDLERYVFKTGEPSPRFKRIFKKAERLLTQTYHEIDKGEPLIIPEMSRRCLSFAFSNHGVFKGHKVQWESGNSALCFFVEFDNDEDAVEFRLRYL